MALCGASQQIFAFVFMMQNAIGRRRIVELPLCKECVGNEDQCWSTLLLILLLMELDRSVIKLFSCSA